MAKLTLHDLADAIANNNDITPDEAEQFVSAVFDIIHDAIDQERLVKIKGLGTFKVIDVNARESVNVNTGERVLIDGHSKVAFTPDSTMKELINKPFADFETIVLNDGVDFPEEMSETPMDLNDSDSEVLPDETSANSPLEDITEQAVVEPEQETTVDSAEEVKDVVNTVVSEDSPVEIIEETPVESPDEVAVDVPNEILEASPVENEEDTPTVEIPEETPIDINQPTQEIIPQEVPVETNEFVSVVENPVENLVEEAVRATNEIHVESPAENEEETPAVEVPEEAPIDVNLPIQENIPEEIPVETNEGVSVEKQVQHEEQIQDVEDPNPDIISVTTPTESPEINHLVSQPFAMQDEVPYHNEEQDLVEEPNEVPAQPVASSENNLIMFVQDTDDETSTESEMPDSLNDSKIAEQDRKEKEEENRYDPSRPKPRKTWWRWMLAVLFGVFIGFFIGFYQTEITKFIRDISTGNFNKSDNYNVTVYENVDLAAIDSIETSDSLVASGDSAAQNPQTNAKDSVATAKRDIVIDKKASEDKSAKNTSEKKSASKLDYLKYEEMDNRVRTGAYYIMGVAQVVKAKEGETVSRISQRYLGNGMSCYVEVLNGMQGSAVLKAEQEVKIPKLVLKRSVKNKK